jgi:hypothetical protein
MTAMAVMAAMVEAAMMMGMMPAEAKCRAEADAHRRRYEPGIVSVRIIGIGII